MSHEQASPGALDAGSGRSGAAAVILLMFFLSGVAALVYQIVWTRQLYLIFGVTIYATSAVVTTFMAGLALGSLYFGRVVDRWRRPLVLFALLELGIGIFGLAFPLVLQVLRPAYAGLYGSLEQSHYVLSLLRFALAFVVLIVPTLLMGGTLPVLARARVTHARRLGGQVAGLYSANNLGAFLGCMLAGYAFIELFGLTGTLRLAAALNFGVVALALALNATWGRRTAPDAEPDDAAAPSREPVPRAVKVALWVFAIEGFTSLTYQMAWMRMLIFFVQANIYAVTTIVATFLVGLSLGAFAVKRWIDRAGDPYRMLGIIEVGIGLTALVTVPLLPWLLRFQDSVQATFWQWGWAGSTLARFVICFVVILVPTTFMGATMPVVSRIYVPHLKGLGRKMGLIGCLDTVGSILGAFAGGFVLIPLLGIQRTIIATALINLALAAWVLWADPVPARKPLQRGALLVALAALLVAPALLLLRPLPLINASKLVKPILERKVLYYDEGLESTISVIDAYRCKLGLFVDHTDVAWTDRFDRPSHELAAHVPLFLHPNPKRVLLIGFGIGFTARTCRVHDTQVDIVELNEGVIRANKLFVDYNDNVLADPGVHLRIDDGRNYVLGTRHKYDVIHVSILYPALNSGNSSLFTSDFFRECRRVLAPGGVMSQWLPIHGMPHESFRMIIRSFQDAYPHMSIWYKHTSNFCTIVGTVEPLRIDFQNVERRVNLPEIKAHLSRCNVRDVYDLLDSYCCGGERLRERLGPGPMHSDDHPYLEFTCNRPFRLFGYPETIAFLTEGRESVWPLLTNVPPARAEEVREGVDYWARATRELSKALYYAAVVETFPLDAADYRRMFDEMNACFARTLALNPKDENAAFLWRKARAAHELLVARSMMAQGHREGALAHLENAMQIAPGMYPAAEARFLRDQILAERGE